MDEGSTITLVDAEIARALEIEGPRKPLELSGVNNLGTFDLNSQMVSFGISALDNNVVHKISLARTVENLNLLTQTLTEEDLRRNKHLLQLPIACYTNAKPLLLIGQDYWNLITATQTRSSTRNQPVASLTQLGWVVHGRISNMGTGQEKKRILYVNESPEIYTELLSNMHLNSLIKFHFTFESLGVTNFKRKNKLEEKAEKILDSTTTYVNNRWKAGLLWKHDQVKLPNNRENALARLRSLERKCDKDGDYATRYYEQVNHLIASGYAEKIKEPVGKCSKSWYLPHFGVVNPNKPSKLRLVFDGAAKTNGTSLNDNLLTGPDLTNSLFGVLVRFRQKKVAIKGDIREMFLQIKIREEDRPAQMFLWRGADRDRTPDTYVMTSMFFGSASSPYTAQYVMRKNALEFESIYPKAVNAILNKHYVDDYLDSFDSVEEGTECIKNVSLIHARGGFEIRNWSTNYAGLLKGLPVTMHKAELVDLLTRETPTEKTPGLRWNTTVDTISFDLNLKKIPVDLLQGIRNPTKRQMLRTIMSIYDPLGMLLPFTIRSKMLLQEIWRSGIGWDEELKGKEFDHWKEWISALKGAEDYYIPRAFCRSYKMPADTELHVFSDASEKAYSAVAYLRSNLGVHKVEVSFIAGKARVAPLKTVSIPRMELQGALLASRLGDTITNELEIKVQKRFFWTDSRTVLGWISSDPRKYQSFVAHRLGEIDELTNVEEWNWVPSKQNPADCATRSIGTINILINQWLRGPEFLSSDESRWPEQQWKSNTSNTTVEIRKQFAAAVCIKKAYESPNINNFSKWLCLVRSTALVLSVARIWKNHESKVLTAEHLLEAEKYLIQKVQAEDFAEEILRIKNKQPLPKGSRLRYLSPSIDDDGLLKIDGRIGLVKGTLESVKCPIILDGNHRFTRLLIQHYHERFHHGSTETVVNELRQKFWILRIRPTLKFLVSQCGSCRVRTAKPEQPRMGNLPSARLGHHRRPFTYCGLDYFGPMTVNIGRKHEKRWGALFTCRTTRAIHVELVSSLSTDSAIMALQRISNRRGTPTEIYTDNGTNFAGMNNELKRAIKEIDADKFRETLTNIGIKWRFIPPATPHMGGSWERLVRSVKISLAVVLKERAPKEEILRTLLTEVEHTVNSRPLTNVSTDFRDQEALTPNHWLIGSSSGAVIWGEFSPDDLNRRKQWRVSQRLADMFWGRWLKKYLPNLVVRKCWNHEVRNLSVGDVVLIVDQNLPRNVWPRGQVTKTYPGRDGRVRVVDILSRGKVLKRAANKIIVLVPTTLGTEMTISRTQGEDVDT